MKAERSETRQQRDLNGNNSPGGKMPPIPIIEFQSISKKFGAVYANRDISLKIARGEIHAIVGENGAGKTTLMNVLFGRLRPDTGSIVLRGAPVSFRSEREAIRAGIGMVHQDILFFPQLSVLENIILGCEAAGPPPKIAAAFGGGRSSREPYDGGGRAWEPGPPGFAAILRTGRARKEASRIRDSLGLHLDLDRQAKELPFAQRQQIELVRLIYRGAEILILDEPTSLLSPDETEKFLHLMKSLREGGRTVLFISHRLGEVFSAADRITVLRKGYLAATLDAGSTGVEEIAGLMVGGRLDRRPGSPLPPAAAGRWDRQPRLPLPSSVDGRWDRQQGSPLRTSEVPVLELQEVGVGPSGTEPALRDIPMSVGRGEIFGIGGIVGNGQRSLARVIAGKTSPDTGFVRFEGADISRLDIKERLGKNIRWLPGKPGRGSAFAGASVMGKFSSRAADGRRICTGGIYP